MNGDDSLKLFGGQRMKNICNFHISKLCMSSFVSNRLCPITDVPWIVSVSNRYIQICWQVPRLVGNYFCCKVLVKIRQVSACLMTRLLWKDCGRSTCVALILFVSTLPVGRGFFTIFNILLNIMHSQ